MLTRVAAGALVAALLPIADAGAAPRKAKPLPSFSFFGGPSYVGKPKPRRAAAAPAAKAAKTETAKAPKASGLPPGPHVIVVSIKKQNVTVYGANGETESAPVSTGTKSNPTPSGIFTVIQKNRIHFSNLYNSAPMPNMQRITWSGVALHAGYLPGYPASHGCIRMPYAFSSRLFAATKMGTRVIVARDDVHMSKIESGRLFAALPPGEPAVAAAPPAANQPSGDMAVLVGVTAAEAAPSHEPKDAPRTRASVLAAKQAELARLAEAVKAAEAAQLEAVERNKPTIEAAAEAFKVVRKAKSDAERLERTARLAERAKAAAEERYAKLNKKAEAPSAAAGNTDTSNTTSDAPASTDVTPDPKLVELTEKARTAREEADAQAKVVAEAEAKLVEANAIRLKATADARVAAQALNEAKEAHATATRAIKRFNEPVSVFISRATGKLYVRQGWEPVLEAPVTIANPAAPLGHHVYTALAYQPGETAFKWSVASVNVPPAESRVEKATKKSSKKGAPPPPAKPVAALAPPSTPAQALERIEIPKDVRERIVEMMKPGSSLIVSDAGISNETGKYTDFIVQPR